MSRPAWISSRVEVQKDGSVYIGTQSRSGAGQGFLIRKEHVEELLRIAARMRLEMALDAAVGREKA